MVAIELLTSVGGLLGAVLAAFIAANRSGRKAADRTAEVFSEHDLKDRSDFLALRRTIYELQVEAARQIEIDAQRVAELAEWRLGNDRAHDTLQADLAALRRSDEKRNGDIDKR